jgi:oligopeptidase A
VEFVVYLHYIDVCAITCLLCGAGLPQFSRVKPAHVEPAITSIIARIESELTAFENTSAKDASFIPKWSNVIEPLERWHDALNRAWGVVGHLSAVRDSDELRAAVQRVEPQVVAIGLKIGQSQALFESLQKLSTAKEFKDYSPAQQRIVTLLLRDARLSGVSLTGKDKEQFNTYQSQLATYQREFANHVLDSTKRFVLVCTTKDEVSGVPANALALAAEVATNRGVAGVGGKTGKKANAENGPWAFTLDAPMITYVQRYPSL